MLQTFCVTRSKNGYRQIEDWDQYYEELEEERQFALDRQEIAEQERQMWDEYEAGRSVS